MRRILFIITLLVVSFAASAGVFDRPSVVRLVVDNANVFTPEQYEALTAKLDSFERVSTVQIQIYTTTDLHGYDIMDFAQRLGEGWGVGQDSTNNGIVIVYKPKTQTEKGEVTIQTGYGIEPLIPDATCKRIIEQEMIPLFRINAVYEGIVRAVDICISLTNGVFTADDYGYSYSDYGYADDSGSSYEELTAHDVFGVIFFFVFLIVSVILSTRYANKHPGKVTSGHSGSYSSHSSRSYGGGHFGGGGAHGSW